MTISNITQIPPELLVYLGQFIDTPGPVASTCRLFKNTVTEGYYLFLFSKHISIYKLINRRIETNVFLNIEMKVSKAYSFLVKATRFVKKHNNTYALQLPTFHPKHLDQYVFLLMYNGVAVPQELVE